jgi:NAD(P)-dependent dehydrogenase (short-subunit alcohol dehydrogenase family)
MDATALLRPHLLDGRVVALGGGGEDTPLGRPLATLGAATPQLPAVADEEAMAAAVDPGTHALVHDLRPAFGAGDGDEALRATLDLAWITVRAVANAAFIPQAPGGKVVVIAPRAGGSESARPAAAGVRAAAENLARTLSIEWARHAITTVAITPGVDTDDFQLAAFAAYLVSPAGDYFSGCRLALGEVALTA